MEELGRMWPYLLLIVVVAIGSIIYNYYHLKNKQKDYLHKYPDAVKVYCKVTNYVVANSSVTIILVDHETPAYFQEGMKTGAYIKPGKSRITVRFDASRVGFFYKHVNTYVDPVEIDVDLKAGNTYELTFDQQTDEFKIQEKTELGNE